MKILIVVVLYRTQPHESETLTSLSRAFQARPDLLRHANVVLWDNSPAPLDHIDLPFSFEYGNSGQNLGISGAYNRAAALAETKSCAWMLLLDQDTTFSEQFLARMVQYADNLNPDADVAAVVPFLKDGDRAFSPTEIRFGGSRAIHPPAAGKYKARAYAANSGTLMRVSALSDIGGYDERFWLDYSDIVVFHKLYDLGRCIYVAGDLQVQHNLAARNYDRSMSPERYRNFISAEGAYWDLFRGSVESIIHMFRLLARTVKQYFRYSEKSYAKDTWRAFCCRLITSRQQRLREWPNRTASRDLPRLAGPDRAGSGLPL